MAALKHFFVIMAAAWGLVLMPADAMAYTLLSCTGSGGVAGGELFPVGQPGNPGACAFTGLDHVFSTIICNFVVIINDILGKTYCGMQFVLTNLLAIVFTVYIAVFGVQILMGSVQMTAREILVRLLKIAGVWAFVTQSAWGIGLAFAFFVDLAGQGVWWGLSAIPTVTLPSGPGLMPVYMYLDQLIFDAVIGPFTQANSEVIGFFAALGFVAAPIFGMAVYWLITTFTIFARAVISFMLAVAALAFLISMSPIFLSFMLFMVTYQFFENWLKYMISYALQILVIFACIALWLTTIPMMIDFFNQLSAVVFEYKKVQKEGAPVARKNESWGVCPYIIKLNAFGPTIECATQGFDPKNVDAHRDALIPLSNVKQKINEPAFNQSGQPTNRTQTGLNMLLYFVIYHLVALIIIAYAFDALLKKAYDIAIQLAGPQYVPMLGQGFGGVGYGVIRKGATKDTYGQGNWLSGLGDVGRSAGRAITGFIGQTNTMLARRGG